MKIYLLWLSWVCVCWFYDRSTERLTEDGFMEKPGIEPVTPGLQDMGLSSTPRWLFFFSCNEKTVCGFSWAVTSTRPLGFMVCV